MGIRDDKLQRLYSLYGEEKVKEEISQIKDRNKEILMMFFGLDGQGNISAEIIADKYNVSIASIYKIINKELERIENAINYPYINKEVLLNGKRETLKKLYSKYSKKDVLTVLKTLDEKEQNIFNDYYGENGHEVKSAIEMEKIYGLKKEGVSSRIRAIIKKIIISINNENNFRQAYKNTRLERLHNLYGENAIRLTIDNLYPVHKTIMELYLGSKEQKPLSIGEISKIVNMSEGSVHTIIWSSLGKIEKFLQNPNDRTIFQEARKAKTVEQLFKQYGKEKIYKNLNRLSEIDKKVYVAYYGLDGNKGESYKEIAKQFNISEEETLKTIRHAIYDMNSLLNDVDNKDKKLMVKCQRLLDRFTYSDIAGFTEFLKGDEQNIVKMYLGINGVKESFNDLMDLYEMSADELYDKINRSLAKMIKVADNIHVLLGRLYYRYGKKVVEKAMERLSHEQRQIIRDYKQNQDESLFAEFAKQIDNLEKEINEMKVEALWEEAVKTKRKEMLRALVVVKDKEGFKKALEQLSDDEAEIIVSYFPLSKKKTQAISELAEERNLTKLQMREKILEIINKINEFMRQKNR